MILRKREELSADPNFYFQLARLIGMCEMFATYLHVHGDEKAQQMAARADATLRFWFEREPREPTTAIKRRN